jgi:hypothetical protein
MNAKQRLLHAGKNKHMRAAKEASITPNRDTTRGKKSHGGIRVD